MRFIPDWFPGAGFKRLPPGTREDLLAMRDLPFDYVKQNMVCRIPSHFSLVVSCPPKGKRYLPLLLHLSLAWRHTIPRRRRSERYRGQYIFGFVLQTHDILNTAVFNFLSSRVWYSKEFYFLSFSFLAQRFKKTLAALMTAVLALVVDPVIQARAQAELDTVVGKHRLPDFSDRQNLPYIQCIISETFRWTLTSSDAFRFLILHLFQMGCDNTSGWVLLYLTSIYSYYVQQVFRIAWLRMTSTMECISPQALQ